MMTDQFELLERSKKWLKAIKAQYKSVAPGDERTGPQALEIGGFKMM
jgi:hypothetical protein